MTAIESLRPRQREDAPFRRELPSMREGNSFIRLVTAHAIASLRREHPAEVVARMWPSDKIVTLAASTPAMTTVSGWAAELVHTIIADALKALGAASSGAQLLAQGLVLGFDGAGQISVPALIGGAGYAGFVAEGNPIPVRQLPASAAQLLAHKLATIAVLTREMIESSNAEQLVGDALVRSCGGALDAALFDANASSSARPAGLRNGIAALTASSSTDLIEAFLEDIATLLNSVSAVGGNGPYALVMSAGRAMSAKIRMTRYLPDKELTVFGTAALTNDIIAVAPGALASAFDAEPETETATAGTLHMSDTPAAIVNGGAPAAPHRSLFQTDSTAVKVRWPMTWALRDVRGVAWLTPTWK